MFTELNSHDKSLRGRVFYLEGKPLAIHKIDFGGKFLSEAMKYISSQQEKASAEAKVLEVEKRLPAARNIFKGLSALHPNKKCYKLFLKNKNSQLSSCF
jgi:hypothetical protein